MTARDVIENVASNLYENFWNPIARTKDRATNYPVTGGLYVNVQKDIDWNDFSIFYDVNQARVNPSSLITQRGGNSPSLHDVQTDLRYLHAAALCKKRLRVDTFDQDNAMGEMGLSSTLDVVTTFFQPTTDTLRGFNAPKGWIYFALLESYLLLEDDDSITQGQKDNLKKTTLYAAWTYYNRWQGDIEYLLPPEEGVVPTSDFLIDIDHVFYQPSQSLLMAAALQDAAQRWPDDIEIGMFWNNGAEDTNSTQNWIDTATNTFTSVYERGGYNVTYDIYVGRMNYIVGEEIDTVKDVNIKANDAADAVRAYLKMYELTDAAQYLTIAQTLITSINTYFWDETLGGYFFSMDTSNGEVNSVYKEIRAQATMLDVLLFYREIVDDTYLEREKSLQAVLFGSFYKSDAHGGGFTYRVKSSDFGIYETNYTPAFDTTLSQAVEAGETSITVASIDDLDIIAQKYNFVIVTLDHEDSEKIEQWAFDLPEIGNTLTLNAQANDGNGLQYAHNNGATAISMVYPTDNIESVFTSEAMGAALIALANYEHRKTNTNSNLTIKGSIT